MKKPTEPLPSERSRDEGRPALEPLVEAPIEQLDLMLREIYRRHCATACS